MIHIFIYVVRSRQDHFCGLKAQLIADGEHVTDVRFSEAEFDLIDSIEYSWKKFFRVFFYPRIFSSLKSKLTSLLSAHEKERINVYISDEGVWAVFWEHLRRQYDRKYVHGINVQHGHADLKPAPFKSLRRLINFFSTKSIGYPALGLGSLGGAGPKAFDLYLTYSQSISDYITKNTGCSALACPHLLKADLIYQYAERHLPQSGDQLSALFIMNMKILGSSIKCNACDTYTELLPLARALSDLNARLTVRLHPGMDLEMESREFWNHPISSISELDRNAQLSDSLKQTQLVFSLYSTALWESSLLGIAAYQLIGKCCSTIQPEIRQIHIDSELETALGRIVSEVRANGATFHTSPIKRIAIDWKNVKQSLINCDS